MSASRPGSVMLRAATAASGGTGAPDWTYCSICAWTLRTNAWTSTPVGESSVSSSTRAVMEGSTDSKPRSRNRCWPWTMARTVPSWSWATWAILARVPTSYSSDGSVRSSRSAGRWVTSAMGVPSATAWLSAWTDLSRPTWSGTIISGKITVSRSATSGSTRRVPSSAVRSASITTTSGSWADARDVAFVRGAMGSPRWCSAARLRVGRVRDVVGARIWRLRVDAFCVQLLQDAHPQSLLELEQDTDPREIDPQVLGQVPDPGDSTDVILGVETDVGGCPGGAHEALDLVDAKGAGMDPHQLRSHADDIDGSARVPEGPGRTRVSLVHDRDGPRLRPPGRSPAPPG